MSHSVLLIDDHDIVRFGMETLIASQPDLRLAGSAGSLAEGLEMIRQTRPDLVITDMGVGDSAGLDTVRAVVEAQAPRPVLVVSVQDEMLYGEQVLALGARGYLMKETAYASVIPAAFAVLGDEVWASPRLSSKMMNRLLRRSRPAAESAESAPSLTARELQVLELLKTGKTTKEIAAALDLSGRTVDIHRANIKKKLGLRTGAELIAYASHRL
jgi:DNA-binding NarL/FixJ family response regulator